MPLNVNEIRVHTPTPEDKAQQTNIAEQEKAGLEAARAAQNEPVDTGGQRPAFTLSFINDPYTGPQIHDTDVASDEARRGLESDQGILCISFEPGEKLGQLDVGVHYVSPKDTGHGEPDRCVEGQNDIAGRVSKWLREVLGDAEGVWDVSIDIMPCPKATNPYRVVDHACSMERELERTYYVERSVQVQDGAEVTRHVEKRLDRDVQSGS